MKEGLITEHTIQKEKLIIPNIQKTFNDKGTYICSAINLLTGDNMGHVEVRRQNHNTLSVEVNEKYIGLGVATKLIKIAQQDHDDLQLLTSIKSEVIAHLYEKLGFKQIGEEAVFNFYIWKKEIKNCFLSPPLKTLLSCANLRSFFWSPPSFPCSFFIISISRISFNFKLPYLRLKLTIFKRALFLFLFY
jgi:hypothetical protein